MVYLLLFLEWVQNHAFWKFEGMALVSVRACGPGRVGNVRLLLIDALSIDLLSNKS